MPLNEELDWGAVGAIITDKDTGATVSNAFQLMFGPPSKDLLPKGMKIYKFNTYPSISKNDPPPGDLLLRPWWTSSLPYKHDGGLVQKLKMAEANGVSARECGRLTSAIREDWSSLAYILEIELAEPVYAWFGGFKGMPRKGKGTSMRNKEAEGSGKTGLPGGGTQFYIPNLTYSAIASHSIKPV
jgi:hypothetical protein